MVARLTSRVAFLSLFIVFAVGVLASQPALAQNFITVDYPGGTLNSVRQINNHGEMAGRYVDAEGVYHGFVFQNGVFTAINFPGALGTAVWGINDNGDLVGRYLDAEGITNHGFLLHNGVFTTIDPPSTIQTYALGTNSVGQIVGFYDDAAGHEHGFLLSAGVYSTVDFPGSSLTDILKVNNVGDMIGIYDDSSGNEHGFLLQNGTFTSIDYPGAFLTDGYGINDGGQIVGGYLATDSSNELGFEDINGTFTTINFPAAVDGLLVQDINDVGQLAGEYVDAAGALHGFVSSAGPFAYVANTANYSGNTVSVIDIPTSLAITTIPVGTGPYGVAVSPNGNQVYVSNSASENVSVIDTASSSVVATIPVQSSPAYVAFTPDGTSAYVANYGSNSVSVIDTASRTVVATVPVQSGPAGVAMALTSKGTFAYVTNYFSNTVSVIAVGSSPTVVQTIPVGTGPQGVAVAPNSSQAYVDSLLSNTVSVISVATNQVTATIPVGNGPQGVAFTPDGSFAYVANTGSNTVSVIDTASASVVATAAGFNVPFGVAVTADGTSAYVANQNANNVSVIATASNTITGTVAVGSGPQGVAIASAPPTELQITLPLSPTQPNVFNFGTYNQAVQYPPGTSFSGVNMTTAAVEIAQAQFQQRVAHTQFAKATCIVYASTGGNCVDFQVTCSDNNGNPIACPGEPEPSIAVQTGFSTSQTIINPGYLTTPIGENQWKNIFTGYADPVVRGKTQGFSEFVAVDLGATNPQGLAQFEILHPLFPKKYLHGGKIWVAFRLTSVTNGEPITDATASISVVMIADAAGNPTQQVVVSKINAFKRTGPGIYTVDLWAGDYAAGTYNVTIYGDAFPAYQGQFKILK